MMMMTIIIIIIIIIIIPGSGEYIQNHLLVCDVTWSDRPCGFRSCGREHCLRSVDENMSTRQQVTGDRKKTVQ
jgi:hypothetical protein